MNNKPQTDKSEIEPILNADNFRFTLKPISKEYEIFWKLYKKQQAAFWIAEEIDFSKDYQDFSTLNADEQYFIKMVLAFFAASDGIVNFNLRERFLKEIMITEAQVCYGFQLMMENIHCVSSDTKIMTDNGYITIGDYVDKSVNVWNGKEFNNVVIKNTGTSQLYDVILSNGMNLKCTSEHKWFINCNGEKQIIYTKNLKIGDAIYDYKFPILDINNDDFKNPYIHGFFCGSGDIHEECPVINHNVDAKLEKYLDNPTIDDGKIIITNEINKHKYFVPINYSKNTKLKWLEGLFDSIGQCSFERDPQTDELANSIQILCDNVAFLRDVQLLLSTLDINSKVSDYGIYIPTVSTTKLINMGFDSNKLGILILDNTFYKKDSITVESVTLLDGIHETYCFNESIEHSGIFNGILTGQSEIYSDMLINIVKNKKECDKLFNAITEIPSVKAMADWAFKWIQSQDTIAHRVIAFAIVEGIFFSGAFAAIFWLKKQRGEEKYFMAGLVKSNNFISRDEGLHVNFACVLYSFIKNKVPVAEVNAMIKDAVKISQDFATDAIKCQFVGMNGKHMGQYIEYVADRLLVYLNYEKLYNSVNPFDFMETIGFLNKDNFFENRPDSYQKSHNENNRAIGDKFVVLDDF